MSCSLWDPLTSLTPFSLACGFLVVLVRSANHILAISLCIGDVSVAHGDTQIDATFFTYVLSFLTHPLISVTLHHSCKVEQGHIFTFLGMACPFEACFSL